jgi:hypothetical protein
MLLGKAGAGAAVDLARQGGGDDVVGDRAHGDGPAILGTISYPG